MTGLAMKELGRYEWATLPVMGNRSARVPESLEGLIRATTKDDAILYYWELENVVVVQGQLFEAAPAVVSVLMAALADEVSDFAKLSILELLFQLVSGESDQEAVARGNPALGDHCRSRAREGLWVLYCEGRGQFKDAVREILEKIELDEDRLNVHCPPDRK